MLSLQSLYIQRSSVILRQRQPCYAILSCAWKSRNVICVASYKKNMDQFLRPKGRYQPCPKQIPSYDRNEMYEEVEVEHYLPSPYGPLTFKKVVTMKKEKSRQNNPDLDSAKMSIQREFFAPGQNRPLRN